jgi:phosphohistidine phosphatase
MKHLYLLRHAKSDWGSGFSSDHERPLAPRGEEAARSVGRFLAALGRVPDEVVSSTAVRARTTAELAKEEGRWEAEIETTEEFYGAHPADLLTRVQGSSDSADWLLIVGHEPTWSETVGLLIGRADIRMVTAALARVDFSVESWQNVEFGGGELVWLVTPKLLAAAEAAGQPF